jgi:hypothetical protein
LGFWVSHPNPIQKKTFFWFEPLSKIQSYVFIHVLIELKSLHVNTFKELAKLKRLNIIRNRLKTLPDIIFQKCTSLQQISLSQNEIVTLDSLLLDGLIKLERFYAHSNKLEFVPKNFFNDGLTSLKLIDLGFNRISRIEEGNFSHLTQLEILDFSRNVIESLDENIFVNLGKVSELYLNKNLLHDSCLNSLVMHGMKLLKVIQLDFNQITYIAPDLFKSNENLIEVFCNSAANMKELQVNIMQIHKQKFLDSIAFLCKLVDKHEGLLDSREAFDKVRILNFLYKFVNNYSHPH